MKKEKFSIDNVKIYGNLVAYIFLNFISVNKNKYKLFNKNNNAFTLVELIIVITILAILATIAFTSFQNYSGNARDSNRLSTIKNIETGLELFTLKTSQFPTPDEAKIYTGGTDGNSQINQGIIGESVVKIIDLSHIPLDPKDKTNYVYSTFGNSNKYYQVGINSENSTLSFIPQTYASSQSSIVKGNYRFDPTLPSLIVVENEALTNSGIFSPDVCFVMDNGNNNLNDCREKKSEMILKDYDNSLVGYWDMETLTGNLLKDLSGNQYHGTFSGNILPASTGGLLGNGLLFSGSGLIYTQSEVNYDQSDKITVSIVSKSSIDTDTAPYFPGSILIESSNNANTHSGSFYIVDHYENICGTGKKATVTYTRVDLQVPGNTTRGLVQCPSEESIQNTYKIMTFIFDYKNPNNNQFYINGQKIERFSHSAHNLSPGIENMTQTFKENYQLYMGMRGLNSANGLNGTIDDVKIYTRVLSEEEILQQAKIAGF